ncbi:MAG: alpha/beta hydrolase family protein [Tistlia sp.]|uniref:alpha/beta hydrolase n=1 Tax=Tistlia sp. TaxID=3057121 RepID=UPI0034A5B340
MADARDPYALLEGGLGGLLLRPWFDRLALGWVSRLYFPLSRAWAAAAGAEGSLERFWAGIGGPRGQRLVAEHGLRATRARLGDYEAAERRFQAAAFGGETPTEVLASLTDARAAAAHRFMMARGFFLPLHLAQAIPPVALEVATPAEVAALQGARLAGSAPPWPFPDDGGVEPSASFARDGCRIGWLRFRSPATGEECLARYEEPEDAPAVGTLVFLHGLGMETEFWKELADPYRPLVRRGLRIVRPEGPWHGRRRPAARYGGAPMLGRGPLGLIEVFQAWVAETALLLAHLRRERPGPLAVGGVSLGALTAQLALTAAAGWPQAARPDAALLIATSGALDDLAKRASLTRALGLPASIRAAGWDETALRRVLPLMAPLGLPALPPERVVMVLGASDDLVPYDGGAALAERWAVPADNLFVRPQGHFSVSLGMMNDPAPIDRLLALLAEARP